MDIQIRELTPEMKMGYVDFFDNRAFCDGNVNMGCYCVWHHWTEEKEYKRSQLPAQDRPFCKRNYALELVGQNKLHGFAAFDKDKIIGFCNADLKNNYFRFSREKNPDSWIGIDDGNLGLPAYQFSDGKPVNLWEHYIQQHQIELFQNSVKKSANGAAISKILGLYLILAVPCSHLPAIFFAKALEMQVSGMIY